MLQSSSRVFEVILILKLQGEKFEHNAHKIMGERGQSLSSGTGAKDDTLYNQLSHEVPPNTPITDLIHYAIYAKPRTP
jgi:hypothetical protein